MSVQNAHSFQFLTINGQKLDLSEFKDKVLLIVNTASKCGFTSQYKELEQLHQAYKDKGLVLIGVPSGSFGGQEFENEIEVQNFTESNFEVSFPLTTINDVKGSDAHPFYKWAGQNAGFLGTPKWNFHKYLIDKNGDFVAWYASTTSPTSNKIKKAIERELEK